jgi:Holliday junction resolvase
MSRDAFMRRSAPDSPSLTVAHRRSKKQERELAKRGGGRLVPGSGNKIEKGDVKKYNGVFRIEAKTTKNKSFSVTREMLDKIESVAMAHGELPVIIIEFIDDRGRPLKEVAVVPTDVLDSLNVAIYRG